MLDVFGRYIPVLNREALRVDLLSKRASLSSLDLSPESLPHPYVVLLRNVPLALARGSFLSALELLFKGEFRVEASGIRLYLEQIPFRSTPGSQPVNDAISRLKRARLAEGERKASGMFGRLLRKYMPLLMHRLHIYIRELCFMLRFDGGNLLVVSVDAIETLVVPEPNTVPGDVSRDFVIKDLNVQFNDRNILHLTECTIMLRYRGGEYSVCIRIGDELRLTLYDDLADQVLSFQNEEVLWRSAARYGRPCDPVLDCPRAWWKYACRNLLKRGQGYFEEDYLKSRLAICAEYQRLHLMRLNRPGYNVKVLERCQEIENVLDVETVLFLRSKARSHVLAEKAKQYAAEDWLEWALIGGKVSRSRDADMLQDIRDAASNLEDAKDSALARIGLSPAVGAAWIQTKISFEFTKFYTQLVTTEDNLFLNIRVDDIAFDLTADPYFASFRFDASFGGIAIFDDRSQYLQRNCNYFGGRNAKNMKNHDPDNISDIDSRQPSLSQSAVLLIHCNASPRVLHANMQLAPLSFHLDVSRLTPLFLLARNIHTLWSRSFRDGFTHIQGQSIAPVRGTRNSQLNSSNNGSEEDSSDSRTSSADDAYAEDIRKVSVSIHVVGLLLLMSSGLAVCDNIYQHRNALLVDFTDMRFYVPASPRVFDQTKVQTSLSVYPCAVANDTLEMSENMLRKLNDEFGFIHVVSTMEAAIRELRFAATFTEPSSLNDFCTLNICFSSTASLRVCPRSMNIIVGVVRGIAEEWSLTGLETCEDDYDDALVVLESRESPNEISGMLRKPLVVVDSGERHQPGDTVLSKLRVNVSIQDVNISFGCISEKGYSDILIRGSSIVLERKGFEHLSISAREVALSDTESNGYIRLLSCGSALQGLSFKAETNMTCPSNERRMHLSLLNIGQIEARVSPGLLCRTMRCIADISGAAQADFIQTDNSEHNIALGYLSFTVSIRSVHLFFRGFDIKLLFRVDGLFCRSEGHVYKGYVENVELTDLQGNCGSHHDVIRSRDVEDVSSPIIQRIRFNIRPGITNLHLASMQVVYLRSFLAELSNALMNIYQIAVNYIPRLGKSSYALPSDSKKYHSSDDATFSRPQLTIRGHRILLLLPQALKQVQVAVLDLHEATISSMQDSLLLSARKVSLMTGSNSELRRRKTGNSEMPWLVVVAAMDMDLNRTSFVEVSATEEASSDEKKVPHEQTRRRQDWTFQVKTKAVLLMPSQLRLIAEVLSQNIFRDECRSMDEPVHNGAVRSDRFSKEHTNCGLVQEAEATFDRTSITVEVSGLVLELLKEGVQNVHIAPLASCSLGPIRYGRENLTRIDNFSFSGASVSRYVLEISSIRVDDRRNGIFEPFRQIFSTQPTAAFAGFMQPSGTENDENMIMPGLQVQSHQHTDISGVSQSKTEIQVQQPRFLCIPDLLLRLAPFFMPLFGLDESSSASTSQNAILSGSRTDGGKSLISSKLSIRVVLPQVFAAEKPIGDRTRGVRFFCDEIKIGLLWKTDGGLAYGSHLRCRKVAISLCSSAVSYGLVDTTRSKSSQERRNGAVLNARSGGCNYSSSQNVNLHSLLVAKRPVHDEEAAHGQHRNAFCLSMLDRWSSDLPVLELIKAHSLHAKVPNGPTPLLDIRFHSFALDCMAHEFATLTYVLSRLYVIPRETSGRPMSFPPCSVLMKNAIFRLRIPQQRLASRRRPRSRGDGSSFFRLVMSFTVDFDEDLSSMLCLLQMHALNAFDGQSDSWSRRQAAEPFSFVLLSAPLFREWKVNITDTLRVNLSPLVMKTATHLLFCLREGLCSVKHEHSYRDDECKGLPSRCGDCNRQTRVVASREAQHRVAAEGLRCEFAFDRIHCSIILEDTRIPIVLADVLAGIFPSYGIGGPDEFYLKIGFICIANEITGRESSRDRNLNWKVLLSPSRRDFTPSRRPRAEDRFSHRLILAEDFHHRKRIREQTCQLNRENRISGGRLFESVGRSFVSSRLANISESRSRCAILSMTAKRDGLSAKTEVMLGILGLNISIDVNVLRDAIEWLEMVRSAASSASNAYGRPIGFHVEKSMKQMYSVVVQPIDISLSLRAPRRSSVSSGIYFGAPSILERLIGSEEMSNLRVRLPRIAVHCEGAEAKTAFMELLREYKWALMSRSVLARALRQIPTILSLMRVAVTTYLRGGLVAVRKRDTDVIGLPGLFDEATSESNGPGIIHRVVMFKVVGDHVVPASRNRSLEEMDLDSPNIFQAKWSASRLSGLKIYDRLVQRDRYLRSAHEQFKFYVPINEVAGILMTDIHLLVVRRADESILEPRIPIDAVTKYTLYGDTYVVIHCGKQKSSVQSHFYPRSTSAMLDVLMNVTYSLQCDSKHVAQWLVRYLPMQNRLDF